MLGVGTLTAVLNLDKTQFSAQMKTAEKELGHFVTSVNDAAGAVTGLNRVISLFAIGFMTKELVGAGEAMQSLERRMSVLADSMQKNNGVTEDAGELLGWLTKTALDTGTSFESLSKTFMQLAPIAVSNGVALDDVRQTIKGLIGDGQLMGASNEEMGRAFVALRQIVGKNQLQMEELRGQLGEALPNSMLIVANGLTKLAQGSEEVRKQLGMTSTQTVITTADLNKLITTGSIDGAMALRAFKEGTADFAKFAEVGVTQVSGQFERLKTLFTKNLGGLMVDSGLYSDLAAAFAEVNDWFEQVTTVSKDAAKQIGDAMIEGFFNFAHAIAGFVDEAAGMNKFILGQVQALLAGIWDSFKALVQTVPAWMIEVGVVGFMLFGKGGVNGLIKSILKALSGFQLVDMAIKAAADGIKKLTGGAVDLGFTDKESAIGTTIDRFRAASAERGVNETNGARDAAINRASALGEQLNNADDKVSQLQMSVEKYEGLLKSSNDTYGVLASQLSGERNRLKTAVDEREALVQEKSKADQQVFARQKEVDDALANRGEAYKRLAGGMNGKDDAGITAAVKDSMKALGFDTVTDAVKGDGSALKAVDNLRDKFYQITGTFEGLKDKVKDAGAAITATLTKNPAWSKLTSSQATTLLNEISKFAEMSQMNRGQDDAIKIGNNVESTLNKLNHSGGKSGANLDELLGPGNPTGFSAGQVRAGVYMDALSKLSKMGPNRTDSEQQADYAKRVELFTKYQTELLNIDHKYAGTAAQYRQELDQQNQQQLEKRHDANSRQARAKQRQLVQAQDRDYKTALANSQLNQESIGAFVDMISNPAKFEAGKLKEQKEITDGKRAPGARAYVDDQELVKRRAIAALTEQEAAAGAKSELNLAALEDKRYVKMLSINDATNRQLTLKKTEIQIDEIRNNKQVTEDFVAQKIADAHLSIVKIGEERAALADQTLRAANDDLYTAQQRLSVEQQLDDLRKQRAFYEQTIQQDPALQMQLLDAETQKLLLERDVTQLKADQMMTPQMQEAQFGADNANVALEQAKMYYQYSMSMEQALSLARVNGIRGFVSTFSQGLTQVITGQMKVKDFFKSLLQYMITGIIQFFVTWAVQQIAAMAMTAIFGNGLMATATVATVAAANAATTAWTPAATAASIATFGTATAGGAAAIAMIAGSAAAVKASTMFAQFGPAPGINAIGGGAIISGDLPIAHTGGVYHTGGKWAGDSFDFSRPIKGDEGLALLQDGELIIPSKDAAATLQAMAAAGVPLPFGVGKFHSGGIFGDNGSNLVEMMQAVAGPAFSGATTATSGATPSLAGLVSAAGGISRGGMPGLDSGTTSADTLDSGTVAAMSAPRVDIVNYFDWSQVDAHLQRNPKAVLNVIQQDNRDNGMMRRMARRGR